MNRQQDQKYIQVKGARTNNLRNIDLNIPLGKFSVITGVSGSGKSSLAFDTLYAEGQRRYVESLSSYARQFLGRMPKPDCDFIKGLPPAIAIEQKVITRNPRSTVGTSTEIYDYLRMLFARIGKTLSPISGKEVKKQNIEDIVGSVLSYPEGTRIAILVDIIIPEGRTFGQQLSILIKEGFSRLEKDGEFIDSAELLADDSMKETIESATAPEGYRLLIDRLSVSDSSDEVSRLTDSIETAYFEGHDSCIVKLWLPSGTEEQTFSRQFALDGMEFRMPTDLMFNFNNPYGACPECEGFGKIMGISEDLVIPDKTLSVYQDCVQCWRGEKMKEVKDFLIGIAPDYGFDVHKPYKDLSRSEKDFLWHGVKGTRWDGIDGFFDWVDQNLYKIQYRVMKARYRGKTECPSCHGTRLRPDVEYVKVGGKSITELAAMPIKDLAEFFLNLQLDATDTATAARLLTEINSRLHFMKEVGLGYLTLNRHSNTLSGGESQRINLATSLGSALVGSLYILDEPSIGLHSRDTERLIGVLRSLQQAGNTVVVVEHDEEIMEAADEIIDIGPDAGRHGGELVFQGSLSEARRNNIESRGYTLDYLSGKRQIPVPSLRHPWRKRIRVEGAAANNLKDVDVDIPLGIMTVVTGVSGSGKSTLVKDIFYRALKRRLGEGSDQPGIHKRLSGDLGVVKAIEFIDQNPIGTSSRSNPATYLKAYDEIRKLFADCQLARQMDFPASYFSFNVDGGRCDECKGEGTITIPMQFMADIIVPCEVCGGKRFKQEILEVEYRGRNINDFLDMTVDEAIAFLSEVDGMQERKIIKRLLPLSRVGLGYIKLGQSSSTLSGGENQRVKLAYFLAQTTIGHTVFIFDEPTTGLHFHDITTLLDSFKALVDKGNTIIIIEHNMDIIKSADWIIDVGPEGGDQGGHIVATGTPEQIAANEQSYTGKYLKDKLAKNHAAT